MDILHLKLADITLLAILKPPQKGELQTASDTASWQVVISDGLKGTTHTCSMQQHQLNAVAIMMLAGDEILIAPILDELYEIATPALLGCPTDCYPIP